jgi:hypothetical protein
MTTDKPVHTGLARLRDPFEATDINKLPKPYKADSAKGKCSECGGYHGLPAVHLDYVGHAALTSRLLEADPEWTWDFVATDPTTGGPIFDANGGFWIRLTVCGVTRLGYGDAQGKKGGNAVKEAIGDALRNAGMRFGAALDLWHKGDLSDARMEQGVDVVPTSAPEPPDGWQMRIVAAQTLAELTKIHGEAVANGWATPDVMSALSAQKAHL